MSTSRADTAVRSEPSAAYPWILVGLLWCVSLLNSADRSILIAVMPAIRADYGLGDTQLALVNAVFFWVYAAAAFFSGRIGDSLRRSRVILYGLLFWSVATGLTPLTSSFIMLLGLRAAVALGESTYYPTATALIGDWHGPRMRSRALSVHQTSVFAGALLGALVAGLVADRFDWRAPFFMFAVLGTLAFFALTRVLRDAPIRHTAAEAAIDEEPYKVVLASKPALILCAVFFLSTGAATGVTVWAPTYVHDMLHLSLAGSALVGSGSINGAGFIAVPIGGVIADAWAKRSPLGRWYTAILGLSIAAVLLLPLGFANTAPQVAAVLLAATMGKGLFDGCIYANIQDVIPPHARATAVGMMTTCGFIGAGLAPLFVGATSKSLGMTAGLTSLAGCYFLSVLLLALTRRWARATVIDNMKVIA